MSVEPGVQYPTWAVWEPPVCFYCGTALGGRWVHWMGLAGADIDLHPACVVELTIRLYRDVHAIECTTHTGVTARTLPELRAQLMAEEGRDRGEVER